MRVTPKADSALVDELNARLDRLPSFPLRGPARVVLAALYFFAFYDITVIGVALPTIAKQFSLTTGDLSAPVTLNLAGYVIGAYAFSTVADYVGRRRALTITLAVLGLGALLSAFSWNLASLSIFRLIVGLGTGALISLGATYVAEVMPAKRRGRVGQANMFWAGVGLAGAPWIGLPLLEGSSVGWRILLGLGVIAFVPIALMSYLPESPRWLASNGRPERARAEVEAMEKRALARSGLATLPPVEHLHASEVLESGFPTLTLLRRPYLSRIVIVLAFWIAWYIATYGVLGYEPTLLANMGQSAPNSLLLTAIGDAALPVGALVCYFLIDRVDRRVMVTAITLALTIALVLFAIGSSSGLIVVAGLLFSLTIVPGAAAGYTYTSEIFPTHARASAMAIGDGVGHVGGVLAPTIALASLSGFGGHGTFLILAGFGFIGFLVILIGGMRETTGRSLILLANSDPSAAAHAQPSKEAVK